jgi:sodium-dependent dicarboxylate transporter 2/3/5
MSRIYGLFLFLSNRKALFLGIFLAMLFSLISPPSGLSREGWHAIGLSAAAVIWFASKAVPPSTIAMMILVFHVILGISSYEEIARSFFSESVFFIMGVLMLGIAMINQRLDRSLAKLLTFLARDSRVMLIIYIVFFSALTTALMGEYVASTLLLPFVLMVISSEKGLEIRRSRAKPYLLALGFGCIIGGCGALSGGARNVVILQFLKEHHQIQILYGGWIRYTFPLSMLLVIFASFLIYRAFFRKGYLGKKKPLNLDEAEWKKPLSPEDKTAMLIFAVIFFLWLFYSSELGMGIIALFGAALFMIFGLVKWEDYNKGVNWGVVLLYAAVVMLGTSLYERGAADWLAQSAIKFLGGKGSVAMFLPGIMAVSIPILSNLMGAIGVVSIFGPFFLRLASISGMNCAVAGVFLAVASSFAHISYTASPANSIIYSTGYLRWRDFIKLGWKMTVVSVIVLLFISRYWWSFF